MQRIACLVPVGVILAAYYVQKIALRKAEIAGGVLGLRRLVVVKRLDNLQPTRQRSSQHGRSPTFWLLPVHSGARIGLDDGTGLGVAGRLTFFGGTMAIASLGGIEMWCGRESFSPFIERRN